MSGPEYGGPARFHMWMIGLCLVVVGFPAMLSASETSGPLADSRTISTPGLNLQGCQAP